MDHCNFSHSRTLNFQWGSARPEQDQCWSCANYQTLEEVRSKTYNSELPPVLTTVQSAQTFNVYRQDCGVHCSRLVTSGLEAWNHFLESHDNLILLPAKKYLRLRPKTSSVKWYVLFRSVQVWGHSRSGRLLFSESHLRFAELTSEHLNIVYVNPWPGLAKDTMRMTRKPDSREQEFCYSMERFVDDAILSSIDPCPYFIVHLHRMYTIESMLFCLKHVTTVCPSANVCILLTTAVITIEKLYNHFYFYLGSLWRLSVGRPYNN